MAFRGEHYHTVDDKGRVIIPLKFRNELGTTFVMTKGIGGCLFIYREKDFQDIEERLQARQVFDEHAMRLKRWLFASASDTQVDTQGRVAIPANLRAFSGIEEGGEVVIAGTIEKIEVWSRAKWDTVNEELDDAAVMEAARRTGLGETIQ